MIFAHDSPANTPGLDCGMIHYPDKAVRKTLREISASEKLEFEGMEFGEINGS